MLYMEQTADKKYKYTKTNLFLTRGDTHDLNVVYRNTVTDEVSEIGEGDKVTLTVRKSTDSDILLQKVFEDTGHIHLLPEDTVDLEMGAKYVYDIEVELHTGGRYTIIPPSDINILPEVTY